MTDMPIRPIYDNPVCNRYAAAMRDSRELLWRKVGPNLKVELGRTYVGAVLLEPEKVWALVRVQWCDDCGHFEVAQSTSEVCSDHTPVPVTHLAPDVLGVPRLRSS